MTLVCKCLQIQSVSSLLCPGRAPATLWGLFRGLNMDVFDSEKDLVPLIISEQQNALVAFGIRGGGVGKCLFLDSSCTARKRHWRGMADQFIPSPRKAPTEGKPGCGTSGVPLVDAEAINTPHSLARSK